MFLNLSPTPKIAPKDQKISPKGPKKCKRGRKFGQIPKFQIKVSNSKFSNFRQKIWKNIPVNQSWHYYHHLKGAKILILMSLTPSNQDRRIRHSYPLSVEAVSLTEAQLLCQRGHRKMNNFFPYLKLEKWWKFEKIPLYFFVLFDWFDTERLGINPVYDPLGSGYLERMNVTRKKYIKTGFRSLIKNLSMMEEPRGISMNVSYSSRSKGSCRHYYINK